MKNKGFTVFVNTTDNYEDCWVPFFTLFKIFWPNYSGNIYLNTERKTFVFSGLNIVSIKNGQNNWTDCLRFALSSIENDYILYLQEDYFMKDYVKHDLLNQYFECMTLHDIDCLHLTDQHSSGPFRISAISDLVEISQKAKDRISCQAAIWKRDIILSYLRKGETGWQFERYGTMRSHHTKHKFYAINHNKVILNKLEIIPYIFTGIVQGKWQYEVKELFTRNFIEIDFSKRGFYTPMEKDSFIVRLKRKIKRQPKDWLNYWDILKILLRNILNVKNENNQ